MFWVAMAIDYPGLVSGSIGAIRLSGRASSTGPLQVTCRVRSRADPPLPSSRLALGGGSSALNQIQPITATMLLAIGA